MQVTNKYSFTSRPLKIGLDPMILLWCLERKRPVIPYNFIMKVTWALNQWGDKWLLPGCASAWILLLIFPSLNLWMLEGKGHTQSCNSTLSSRKTWKLCLEWKAVTSLRRAGYCCSCNALHPFSFEGWEPTKRKEWTSNHSSKHTTFWGNSEVRSWCHCPRSQSEVGSTLWPCLHLF